MSALAIFKGIPTTKADIEVCVNNFIEEMLSGDYSALEIDLHLKKVEEIVKTIRENKEVKLAVMNELHLYPEKNVMINGCEVTKKSTSSWNYDLCNDSVLFKLQKEAEEINKALKDRQIFLQMIPVDSITVVNEETGAIDTIYKAEKIRKEIFSVKIL